MQNIIFDCHGNFSLSLGWKSLSVQRYIAWVDEWPMWLFTPWLFYFYRPKQPIQLKRPETKRVISAMVRLAGSPCLPGRNKVRRLLPPATKLGQGCVFTGVCDSVHRGGGCYPSMHCRWYPSMHPTGMHSCLLIFLWRYCILILHFEIYVSWNVWRKYDLCLLFIKGRAPAFQEWKQFMEEGMAVVYNLYNSADVRTSQVGCFIQNPHFLQSPLRFQMIKQFRTLHDILFGMF